MRNLAARVNTNMSFVGAHDRRTTGRPWVSWPHVLLVAMWAWAIWSCAEHWRGNPNYSYGWAVPLLALGFGIRRYLMTTGGSLDRSSSSFRPRSLTGLFITLLWGALTFFLEYSREEMWHPQIVLWSICSLAAISTIAILRIH